MSDTESLREQLVGTCTELPWSELPSEILREAIVQVDSSLDLIEVAIACAEDDTVTFQTYLDQRLVARLDDASREAWDRENPLVKSTIVKPFLFVQVVQKH